MLIENRVGEGAGGKRRHACAMEQLKPRRLRDDHFKLLVE
jgi:hypothetical protein